MTAMHAHTMFFLTISAPIQCHKKSEKIFKSNKKNRIQKNSMQKHVKIRSFGLNFFPSNVTKSPTMYACITQYSESSMQMQPRNRTHKFIFHFEVSIFSLKNEEIFNNKQVILKGKK